MATDTCKRGFFLRVRVLSRLFRWLFLAKLQTAHQEGRLNFYVCLAMFMGSCIDIAAKALATDYSTAQIVLKSILALSPNSPIKRTILWTHRRVWRCAALPV